MITQSKTVFVVDDDVSIRDSLRWLLESIQLQVETFESGQAFLSAYTVPRDGCLVLDVRMPGMSGLELMKRLHHLNIYLPIIFLSAHGDLTMAVESLKNGAFNFIEKPYKNQRFIDCVQEALEHDSINRKRRIIDKDLSERLNSMTSREREIISMVVAGNSSKEIGKQLDISYKTVEAHRGRLMVKMGVSNVVDMVRIMSLHYSIEENNFQRSVRR